MVNENKVNGKIIEIHKDLVRELYLFVKTQNSNIEKFKNVIEILKDELSARGISIPDNYEIVNRYYNIGYEEYKLQI